MRNPIETGKCWYTFMREYQKHTRLIRHTEKSIYRQTRFQKQEGSARLEDAKH